MSEKVTVTQAYIDETWKYVNELEAKLQEINDYVQKYKEEAQEFIEANDKPKSIPYRDHYWLEKGIFGAYDALTVEVLEKTVVSKELRREA